VSPKSLTLVLLHVGQKCIEGQSQVDGIGEARNQDVDSIKLGLESISSLQLLEVFLAGLDL
jgi:hypothetical protein